MSPLDDGIDHRPLVDFYVELWKWCDEQGLPHMSAEELANEDVTPEQRGDLAVFIERRKAMLARQPVPATVYPLNQVEAAFVRLFRDAGIDCAVHKAKKAIEEAVIALAAAALVAPSDGPEERGELNAIANDAETLAERLNYAGDMGIDDELLAQAQAVLSDLATQASRRGPPPGRPKKAPATHAALVVIEMFEEITGFKADSSKPGKPRILEPLVRHTFSVLAINGEPRAAIAAALRERRSS
jgi:hypothetical protein